MKKILFILITIPLIFGSCEKEDDSPDSNSNNPIGNTPTGTTGYWIDYKDGWNYDIHKTTNSGVSWSLQSTFNVSGSDFVDFVD